MLAYTVEDEVADQHVLPENNPRDSSGQRTLPSTPTTDQNGYSTI